MSERDGRRPQVPSTPPASQTSSGAGERATPARAPGPGTGMARWMGGGMPTERSLDFRGSSLRLLRTLRPD